MIPSAGLFLSQRSAKKRNKSATQCHRSEAADTVRWLCKTSEWPCFSACEEVEGAERLAVTERINYRANELILING